MTTEKTTDKDEGPRNFGVLLSQLEDGEFVVEASTECRELMRTLRQHAVQTQKETKGVMTISLAFSVDKKGQHVAISPNITIKRPAKSRGGSMMFLTRGGNLTVDNPRQQQLPLHEVPAGGARAAEVPAPSTATREV